MNYWCFIIIIVALDIVYESRRIYKLLLCSRSVVAQQSGDNELSADSRSRDRPRQVTGGKWSSGKRQFCTTAEREASQSEALQVLSQVCEI